jgi:hypothetical protein
LPKSKYSDDQKLKIIEKVLKLITEDGKLPTEALKKVKICRTTWYNWVRSDPDLSDQFIKAKHILIDRYFEEILAISRDTKKNVHDRRLEVDTMKWFIAKSHPKRYGDKLQLSGDEENPIKVDLITRRIVKAKDEAEDKK